MWKSDGVMASVRAADDNQSDQLKYHPATNHNKPPELVQRQPSNKHRVDINKTEMDTKIFPSNGGLTLKTDPHEMNESDVESDTAIDDDVDIETAKLASTHRDIYEKFKLMDAAEKERTDREEKIRHEGLNGISDKSDSEDQELDLRVSNNHRMMYNFPPDRRFPDLKELKERALQHHETMKSLDSMRAMFPPSFVPHPAFYGSPVPPRSPGAPPDRYSRSPSAMSESPNAENGQGHHWTFEEQFKQLYELTDDPKRKEFLDDLFSYMQKRGTPVNRIPIMAKQTLDLYELFRLVVSKGGLVEVINRKLWREITKGLNLPSSITSAAFTLRTQYMKYLYPYECEKLKLSSPAELQNAIDGNRREGRRSGYGFDLSPGPPTLVPPPAHHHPTLHGLNASLMNGKMHHPGAGSSGEDESLPSPEMRPRSLTDRLQERDAIAMEAASRAMEEATRKMEAASRASAIFDDVMHPRKRLALEEERYIGAPHGIPSAHLKITSRNDGRSEIDTSLVVSMEVNGIMYQGVLFAQPPRRI